MMKGMENQKLIILEKQGIQLECSMPKKFDAYVVYKVDNQENSNVDYCYRVSIVPQSYSEA